MLWAPFPEVGPGVEDGRHTGGRFGPGEAGTVGKVPQDAGHDLTVS